MVAGRAWQARVRRAMSALSTGRYHRPMRRRLTWLLVSLGIAALVRRLRRRREDERELPTPASTAEDDPADELRRKLAESRSAADEETAEASEPPAETVEARRADVHEQGRTALDDMRDAEKE